MKALDELLAAQKKLDADVKNTPNDETKKMAAKDNAVKVKEAGKKVSKEYLDQSKKAKKDLWASVDKLAPDATVENPKKEDDFTHWFWIGPLLAVVVIGLVAYFFLQGDEAVADDESDAEDSSQDSMSGALAEDA
jgi:hypothetical protein